MEIDRRNPHAPCPTLRLVEVQHGRMGSVKAFRPSQRGSGSHGILVAYRGAVTTRECREWSLRRFKDKSAIALTGRLLAGYNLDGRLPGRRPENRDERAEAVHDPARDASVFLARWRDEDAAHRIL